MTNVVADTIIQQLGGRNFVIMTGAKVVAHDGPTTVIRFPKSRNSDGEWINRVAITLESDDTYTLKFGLVRSLEYKESKVATGVMAENLARVSDSSTGLRTTL